MTTPTLYFHPLASFCHKVLVALYENGTGFERRIIDLSDAADRAALEQVWPFTTFPVLHDVERGRKVPESSIIVEYLDQRFPGPAPLVPHEREAALDVRLLDRFFDNQIHIPMSKIVFDRIGGGMGEAVAREYATIRTAYSFADRHLAGRTWAGGTSFSLADCAAAPALFYATTLVPLPSDCAALHAYFERLIARPSVARVLAEARPYFAMYPFAEAIPARFR